MTRKPHGVPISGLAVLLVGLLCVPALAQPTTLDTKGVAFFESKIRPVLVEQCYQCHSAAAQKNEKLRGGLLLDTRAGLRTGGDSGPALVPGQPGASLLLKALRHAAEVKMPPKGRLPEPVLADFEAWIKMGAPDPRDGHAVAAVSVNIEEGRKFWAFQPPRAHAPPVVKDAAWPRHDIDHFILAELEKRGLQPVRAADKRAWLRRATFDLLGLPPTPEESDAFDRDAGPEAFARVVDRLLASPHYGERWGRYWLDLARYTDDFGGTVAPVLVPNSYRYRDWVISAFNRDLPYNQFVRLQLAGDLMTEPTDDPVTRLAGLGFQGLGQRFSGNAIGMVKKKIADELDDRVDTVTRSLLGLTVACARCHDHKFDPLPTTDYYALAAAYNGAVLNTEVTLPAPKNNDAAGKAVPPGKVPAVSGGGLAMKLNLRGDPEQLGAAVPPGFLQVLQPAHTKAPGRFTRLELADAIASRANPLTARVWVNRVWHYHFGRGIVGTPSNFGSVGDRPTHPELLDTLAVDFMEHGWSTRWLHRTILLSATYRLSSAADAANAARDADNRYLWRMTPRRLDFEAWRDAMLAVAGKLDPKIGGPSSQGKVELHPENPANRRRTVYSFISRFKPNPTLTLFDFPEPNVTSDQRHATTVPQQQLFALNSPFVLATAKAFAERLASQAAGDNERLHLAWRLAFGRAPTEQELQFGRAFLASPPEGGVALAAWQQLCHSLLTANEFAFIE